MSELAPIIAVVCGGEAAALVLVGLMSRRETQILIIAMVLATLLVAVAGGSLYAGGSYGNP